MRATEIAEFLELKLHGEDVEVLTPVPWNAQGLDTMAFDRRSGIIALGHYSSVRSPDAKRDFFLAVREFFSHLRRPIIIGEHSIISPTALIGEAGFGTILDRKGNPFRVPQIGGLIIGHHCDIGNITTVARGTLRDTILGNYVATDSHVHIAHNCIIGDRCLFPVGATVCGSVTIGNDCYIGAHACIKNQITIGNNCIIGLGAVVVKDIPDNQVWAGNPARFLKMKEEV